MIIFLSKTPKSSSSRSATATDCLFAPFISLTNALKRNGPSTASRKICGFHFPESSFKSPSAGHSTLAPKEYAVIYNIPISEAAIIIEKLYEKGKLNKMSIKNGSLYSKK